MASFGKSGKSFHGLCQIPFKMTSARYICYTIDINKDLCDFAVLFLQPRAFLLRITHLSCIKKINILYIQWNRVPTCFEILIQ